MHLPGVFIVGNTYVDICEDAKGQKMLMADSFPPYKTLI